MFSRFMPSLVAALLAFILNRHSHYRDFNSRNFFINARRGDLVHSEIPALSLRVRPTIYRVPRDATATTDAEPSTAIYEGPEEVANVVLEVQQTFIAPALAEHPTITPKPDPGGLPATVSVPSANSRTYAILDLISVTGLASLYIGLLYLLCSKRGVIISPTLLSIHNFVASAVEEGLSLIDWSGFNSSSSYFPVRALVHIGYWLRSFLDCVLSVFHTISIHPYATFLGLVICVTFCQAIRDLPEVTVPTTAIHNSYPSIPELDPRTRATVRAWNEALLTRMEALCAENETLSLEQAGEIAITEQLRAEHDVLMEQRPLESGSSRRPPTRHVSDPVHRKYRLNQRHSSAAHV